MQRALRGTLCSDRRELLPSVSAPPARTRCRLTPTQESGGGPYCSLAPSLRWQRDVNSGRCRMWRPGLKGRSLHASFISPSPERRKRPLMLVATCADERRGGRSFSHLWIDILSKCQSSSVLLFFSSTSSSSAASCSAGRIVIGD